ncbi:THUMP domain-containing protein [Vogesella sp. XCS3]|uniref:THUMP domain-containing protein n=1 Tax=Vogesella sp. XCS3 TaxID=2877939 RepID=UPI001D0BA055|nr:THUMP domain-containing protein [Vogesella sp. XCS3]UDM16711.1 THUMP domain-containing protein [Vogesella sp. XCS3]
MSTFRSRQRAAQRRQPTSFAERNAPPAGNNAPPAGQTGNNPRFGNDSRGFDKPRFGGEHRRDGDAQPRGERSFDKPRFGGDKPRFEGNRDNREGGFKRDGEFQPRGERSFDKPRFGGDKPRFEGNRDNREGGFKRDGEFQPRGEQRSFDKPRFGGDKPRFEGNRDNREGGFKRDGEFQPRGEQRSFDKPRFGGDKPRFEGNRDNREGGFKRDGEFQPRGEQRSFDKPRFGGDKPRFEGNRENREGGFKRDGEFQPRGEQRSFDKPRFGGDKPRFEGNRDNREGGFKRDGEFQPRGEQRSFDKPRFGGDKPRFEGNRENREGGFKRDGEFQPRGERSFDKPRFGGDKPRFEGSRENREGGFKRDGEFQPRGEQRSFDKPRFEGNRDSGFKREGDFRREQPNDHQPRGEHGLDKPRTLFSVKPEDYAPAPEAAPAERPQKTYTRDRVAGRGGKAHPDYVAPEPRDNEQAPVENKPAGGPVRTSFLKRVSDIDTPATPRSDEPRRESGFQREERSFDKPRFGGERREGGFQREERSFDKPRFGGERREGGFQREERSFDKPHFGGERREGGFQREERSFDKPRFGGERREGGFQRDAAPARTLFGKGEAREPGQGFGKQGGGDKVGRTPFVKAQPRTLKDGEFALFASCPRGLEKLLGEEIALQGGTELQLTDGGVAFTGTQEVMMRVNLHSRTASRLLMQLAMGTFREERDIYTLAKGINWPELFDVGCTIKVKTDGHARLKSIDYVSLIVKDAICDRFRDLGGERPSVDTRTPDMRIRVFLSGFDVQIYLDTSGEALFKRGWRDETGEAPLRENLAAGILLLAGYNGTQPLLDPMCGSGTFLVEAADIALNRAPGRDRGFAFELLKNHNDLLWHSIKNDAELASRKLATLPLYGNDRAAHMVDITRRNLERTGLAELVTLSVGDATELAAPAKQGLIVCNPPYGIRLDEQDSLAELYPQLATWLKRQFAGWTAHLMTADTRLPSLMRLAADSRPMLYNGALECRVYAFTLVEGSNRKEKDDTSGQ